MHRQPNVPALPEPHPVPRSRWVWVGWSILGAGMLIGGLIAYGLWHHFIGVYWELEDTIAEVETLRSYDVLSDTREGAGAPFWGERQNVQRTYAAPEDPATVCDELALAVENLEGAGNVEREEDPWEGRSPDYASPECSIYTGVDDGSIGFGVTVFPIERYEDMTSTPLMPTLAPLPPETRSIVEVSTTYFTE